MHRFEYKERDTVFTFDFYDRENLALIHKVLSVIEERNDLTMPCTYQRIRGNFNGKCNKAMQPDQNEFRFKITRLHHPASGIYVIDKYLRGDKND